MSSHEPQTLTQFFIVNMQIILFYARRVRKVKFLSEDLRFYRFWSLNPYLPEIRMPCPVQKKRFRQVVEAPSPEKFFFLILNVKYYSETNRKHISKAYILNQVHARILLKLLKCDKGFAGLHEQFPSIYECYSNF